MSYIGTIIIEIEVDAETPSEAFDLLTDLKDEVNEALRQEGIEHLALHVGGNVMEYEE